MTMCEDAPCCGCCGTNLYGYNESRMWGDERDQPDYDEEMDPSECKHDRGNYSYSSDPRDSAAECDNCGQDGVRFFLMGESLLSFPFTFVDDGDWQPVEDQYLDGSYEE